MLDCLTSMGSILLMVGKEVEEMVLFWAAKQPLNEAFNASTEESSKATFGEISTN